MSISEYEKLEKQIKGHEGTIPYAYQDSLGYWTIATGRLIDKRKGGGLSQDEIDYLLKNDIQEAIDELQKVYWFHDQDNTRKRVLIELVFNMGLTNLLEFKDMIKCIQAKDYVNASLELIDSVWAKQVGKNRSQTLAKQLRYGDALQ